MTRWGKVFRDLRSRRTLAKRVRTEWDSISMYGLLMAFGAYSTVYPLVSLEQSAPYWASIVLGVEFLISGAFLVIGMGPRKGYRMAGLVVVAVGLMTISLVIATYGGAARLGSAFLFAAFAMQSIYDIRHERRVQLERKVEERQLVEELTRLVELNGQGERP